MSSIRHKGSNRPAEAVPRSTEDAYLGAAREAILAVGWSRTTLTDIAKRAGVSRMTLYRRWPDTGSLLADLMTREWTLTLGDALDRLDHESGTLDALVDGVCATVRALRNNALMTRIIELDPDLLLPYLLTRRGRSQDLIADVLAGQISGCQQGGMVRPGDAVVMARSVLLAAHGFTLSAHTMGRPGTYDRELRTLVESYLRP